ncbi:MAG: GGDEF domain-containing protein [Bacilli bacterium]|nr:GGDEF domain-containing protein [Bacilli bacterium]
MKFLDYLRKHIRVSIFLTIVLSLIPVAGILVYIFVWKYDYVLYVSIATIFLPIFVVFPTLDKKRTKVGETLEKEFSQINHSVEELSINEFEPVSASSPIQELQKLRGSINETINAFRQRNYSAIDKSINLVNPVYVKPDLLTFECFEENLKRLTSRQFLYHSAVVAVQMLGSEKPEYLYDLVMKCKEVVKPALIGQFDNETIVLYISHVTNTSILVTQMRTLLSEYHKTENQRDGSVKVYSCKAGIAIFPFSSPEKLVNDAIEVLDDTKSVAVQDYGLFEPTDERYLDSREKYRRAILYLEVINKNLSKCVTFKDIKAQLTEAITLYCKMMEFDNAGIMLVQDGGRKLIPWFEYSPSIDQSGFINYDSIQVSRLTDYLNLFDNASSLFGINVEDLPFSVRSIFYNISIERYYHFKMTKGPSLVGIIYFNNVEKNPDFTIIDREIMICCCDVIHSMVNMYLSAKSVERQETILSTLLKRDEKYIYSINSKTNELTYVSAPLAKIYPNARPGIKCYNIFNTEQNKICNCCPLKVGNGIAYRPKLGEDISISTLTSIQNEDNEVLMILENNAYKNRIDERMIDPLIGIANDVKLRADYERELSTKGMGYFAFFDIHEFEHWIPKFNIDGEQKILKEIVKRFENLEFKDEVYRFNKSTLCLILRRYTRKDALNIVETIFNEIIKPMPSDNGDFSIEIHSSLIPYPGDMFDTEQLGNAVNSTLEESKSLGVNTLYIYGEKGYRKLDREEYILDIINEAIEKNKFEVFLQPILTSKDKKPIAAESLLRLNDPTRGYIPPSEFVPIAAKNNKMFEIEMYIIDAIGELWKQHGYEIFQQIGVKHISINLSSDTINHPQFVERVSTLMSKHRFPTDFLKFEVSERIVLENIVSIREIMSILRDKGVSWAIDNYGTSISSNKTFADLAISEIKVDRSCINDIERSQRSLVALSYIVDFAKESHFNLVAEGVETEGQLSILNDMKFDCVQGYLFSKPIPIREYIRYLNFRK